MIFAAGSRLRGILKIPVIEYAEVVCEQNITGADFARAVFHDRVNGQGIVLHQFSAYRKKIKLLDRRCGFSDAVIQKHVEFQILSSADPNEIRHIERL